MYVCMYVCMYITIMCTQSHICQMQFKINLHMNVGFNNLSFVHQLVQISQTNEVNHCSILRKLNYTFEKILELKYATKSKAVVKVSNLSVNSIMQQ